MRLLLAFAVTMAALWLWLVLIGWVFETLKPRFERWLWHRLGGSGEPPTRGE